MCKMIASLKPMFVIVVFIIKSFILIRNLFTECLYNLDKKQSVFIYKNDFNFYWLILKLKYFKSRFRT